MRTELKQLLSTWLTALMGGTATVGLVDSVEQGLRMVLLTVSIVSGVFLIAVNWDKATEKLKTIVKRK